MPLLRKLKAVLQLIRPELPLAAGLCVVLGETLALGRVPGLRIALLGAGLGFFLSSSAMVFNDYFDLEVDRVNAPWRPLPAVLLSGGEALAAGVGAALVALALAWLTGPPAAGLALAAWLLGFLYNWKLKAAGLWGNLAVSANVGLTFIMGAIAVGLPWSSSAWAFALIAACFDLAEEIAGDAMDAEGDRERGSQSIAIRRGKQAALRLSAALFGLVIALSGLPVLLGERSLFYLLPVGLMDVLIVIFVARLLRSRTPIEGRTWMRRLYLSASLGLLAFLIGRLFG